MKKCSQNELQLCRLVKDGQRVDTDTFGNYFVWAVNEKRGENSSFLHLVVWPEWSKIPDLKPSDILNNQNRLAKTSNDFRFLSVNKASVEKKNPNLDLNNKEQLRNFIEENLGFYTLNQKLQYLAMFCLKDDGVKIFKEDHVEKFFGNGYFTQYDLKFEVVITKLKHVTV